MASGALPYASLRYYLADKLRHRRARRRTRLSGAPDRAYVVFDREEWEAWAGGLYKGPPPPASYFRGPRAHRRRPGLGR